MECVKTIIQDVIKKKDKDIQLEFRIQNEKGYFFETEAKLNRILDEDRNVLSLALVIRDITERKMNERRIYHLAYHDTLTGLPNRRLFIETFREQIQLAKRNQSKIGLMVWISIILKILMIHTGTESGI